VKTVEARGFLARVVQHECDHLDGKLYVQRMADPGRLSYTEEFLKYIRPRMVVAQAMQEKKEKIP
jgi:peptide deformylase